MKEFMRNNKLITLLGIIGVVYFFLAYISPLISPILLALLFVTMFGPLMKKWQEKFHIRRQVSVIVLLLLVGIVLVLAIWFVTSWVMTNAPKWSASLELWEGQIQQMIHELCEWIAENFAVDVYYLEDSVAKLSRQLIDSLDENAIADMLVESFKYAKKLVSGGAFFLTFLIAALLLAKDYDKYMNVMLEQEEWHIWLEALRGTLRYIGSFIKAQLIIIGAVIGTVTIVLFLIKIPNGLLWGLLAGALDVLPFVGTGIVLVPLALIQVMQGEYGKAVVCILLYIGCILIRELLEPRIVGAKMGVLPIAVLTSIYAGIQLFGFIGVVKGPLGFVLIYQFYRIACKNGNDILR